MHTGIRCLVLSCLQTSTHVRTATKFPALPVWRNGYGVDGHYYTGKCEKHGHGMFYGRAAFDAGVQFVPPAHGNTTDWRKIIMPEFRLNNRQWLAKLVAAIVPGAMLCLGSMAVVGLLSHTAGDPRTVLAQFLMWLTVLVWLVLIGSCFLFRSGLRAWGVLGSGAVIAWSLFAILAKVMTA